MTTNRVQYWQRLVSSLRSRSLRRGESADASLVDLSNEALGLVDGLLNDLASVYAECDQLRAEARMRFTAWGQLFDAMPVACLVTDNTGHIQRANRAAARLLNTGAKHLGNRQLLLFSHDRAAFAAAISRLQLGEDAWRFQLTLRPRERKPAAFDALVVATVDEGSGTYLWFLSAGERGAGEAGAHAHADKAHDAPHREGLAGVARLADALLRD